MDMSRLTSSSFLIGASGFTLSACGNLSGDSSSLPSPRGTRFSRLEVATVDDATSRLLAKAGIAAAVAPNECYKSQLFATADESIKSFVDNHIRSGTSTPQFKPCEGSCGGAGGSGEWIDTVTITSGTGLDPFTGDIVDAWTCVTNTWSYYQTAIVVPNYPTVTGPAYYWNQVQTHPASCSVASGTIVLGALAAANYISQNAASFANTAIKVGASALAATVFAGNFIAAGAAATTIAGALTFIGALAACLGPAEWALLIGAVASLVVIAGSMAQCAGSQ